jgi:hypothetical protein
MHCASRCFVDCGTCRRHRSQVIMHGEGHVIDLLLDVPNCWNSKKSLISLVYEEGVMSRSDKTVIVMMSNIPSPTSTMSLFCVFMCSFGASANGEDRMR